MNTLRTVCLIAVALLTGALAACGTSTPAPAPLPNTQATVNAAMAATGTTQDSAAQATVEAAIRATVAAAPTVAPATVVVAPTGEPATATPTPTATKVAAPARKPTPTSAGPLEFTLEFGQSQPRKGDRKVQLTVIVHIRGGVPPYQVIEDELFPQPTTTRVDGVEYVRDWHDCSPAEPHSITVVSADGQKSIQNVMLPYTCE